MALSYRFSNLCGSAFGAGRVTFTPDGDSLAVPSGNRVTLHDLRYNRILTLPIEASRNVRHIVYSPKDPILIVIDESGFGLIVNAVKSVVLARPKFGGAVSDAKFSPCGTYFAAAIDRKVRIYDAPTAQLNWQLICRRVVRNHLDSIVTLDWSADARFLCTASNDLTVRLITRDQLDGFTPTVFVDHRYPLRAAYFSADMSRILSVSRDGTLIVWRWVPSNAEDSEEAGKGVGQHLGKRPIDEEQAVSVNPHRAVRKKRRRLDVSAAPPSDEDVTEGDQCRMYVDGKWVRELKGYCKQPRGVFVSRCSFLPKLGLLLVGFTNGTVNMYELPELTSLYTLNIGSQPASTLAINKDGEWLAIGCSASSQLVVWEWRSESFILKQQSHQSGVRCVACSPALDTVAQSRFGGEKGRLGLGNRSLIVVTGGEDGKVKLWDTSSGFNYMTFVEHTAAVNAVVFTPQGNAIFSASSDGSVRGFDLARYRNFRTFVAPTSYATFMTIAVDGAGETIVAGAQGTQEYLVYVWSIQTGKLLETLSGHESPISSVQFHPHPDKPGVLMSSSWDATIRVWDIFGRIGKGGSAEPLVNQSSVLAAAFDPRGNNQIAAATLSGDIWFWDVEEGTMLGSISGLRDIRSGRRERDQFAANNSRTLLKNNRKMGSVGASVNQNQHFTTLIYSSNGAWLLAGSRTSTRVCVYSTEHRQLVHVHTLTRNLSLDGIQVELNSKFMTEAGVSLAAFDLSDSDGDEDDVVRRQKEIDAHVALPGVTVGELKGRKAQREFLVWQLATSQDGQQWCAATSHGLYVFSVDLKGGRTLETDISQLERFAPTLITRNVTQQNIEAALDDKHFSRAMILALALNDFSVLMRVYHSVYYRDIPIVVQSVPPFLLPTLLNFLRVCLAPAAKSPPQTAIASATAGGTPYMQYHMRWLTSLLTMHAVVLQHLSVSPHTKINSEQTMLKELGTTQGDLKTLCLLVLRSLQRHHTYLELLFGSNIRSLRFLLARKLKRT